MPSRPAKSRGEGTHAWTDAAASASDFDPGRLRRSLARGTRDRLARRRRRDSSLDLRRGRDAGEKARQRARRAWPGTRRPRRDARLEQPIVTSSSTMASPPRGGCCIRSTRACSPSSCSTSSITPRTPTCSSTRSSRRWSSNWRRVCRWCAAGCRSATAPACRQVKVDNLLVYEELMAAASPRIRMAGPRRERRLDPLLHLRHHRQSEGRALQPPLDGVARLRRLRGRRPRAVGARFLPRGGAALSRQRLERAVLRRRCAA